MDVQKSLDALPVRATFASGYIYLIFSSLLDTFYSLLRRRIHTEEKAKVVAEEYDVLHQDDLKKKDEFILFFILC